jgi:hypothetical protein
MQPDSILIRGFYARQLTPNRQRLDRLGTAITPNSPIVLRVPELTCSAGIQLNARVSLRLAANFLSSAQSYWIGRRSQRSGHTLSARLRVVVLFPEDGRPPSFAQSDCPFHLAAARRCAPDERLVVPHRRLRFDGGPWGWANLKTFHLCEACGIAPAKTDTKCECFLSEACEATVVIEFHEFEILSSDLIPDPD